MLRIIVPYCNLPDPVMQWYVSPNSSLLLKHEQMLPYKTAEAVESGHTKSGRILFELPGDLAQEILRNPSYVYIGCSNRVGQVTWQGLGPQNIMNEFAALPGEVFITTTPEPSTNLTLPL